jgi:tRNA threonylcarbamoyl adenosine modification protein (Sua5/YciO/YrdC/YwlC family)
LSKTEIFKLDPINPDTEKIKEAAFILKKGGLVAFPTETVYGLGANLTSKKSIERLVEVKQRPPGKLFSIHIFNKADIEKFARDIVPAVYKIIDRFWPGPLTVILKSKKKSNQTVGIRMPNNKIALDLISFAGVPVVAPSANISGNTPPKTAEEVIAALDGKIDLIIDSGKTELGVSSTVVDFTLSKPQIMREGAIKKSEIEKVINTKIVLFVCTGNSCRSVMAKELLKKKLLDRDDVEVVAAGIGVLPGMSASYETQRLLQQEGIDVSGHRAQQLTSDLVKKADLILAMQKYHEDSILKRYPFAKNRLYLLKEFAKIENGDLDIHDPMGKSQKFYKDIFLVIKEAVNRIAYLI